MGVLKDGYKEHKAKRRNMFLMELPWNYLCRHWNNLKYVWQAFMENWFVSLGIMMRTVVRVARDLTYYSTLGRQNKTWREFMDCQKVCNFQHCQNFYEYWCPCWMKACLTFITCSLPYIVNKTKICTFHIIYACNITIIMVL